MEEVIKYLSIPVEQFSISPLEDDDRIAKLEMKFMHDKENINKSFIDLDVIKTALNNSLTSVTGVPILASFNEEGTDFQEHNDDEISIGYIPQINNNLNFQKDEEKDKTYVYVDAYIWRHYSKNAVDILEKSEEDGKACSIEIEILDGYRDKKRKLFIITEFKFLGITILGSNYKPGMEGANVKLDYSQKETYINHLKELNEILTQYFSKNKIDDLNINNKDMDFIKKDDYGTGDKIEIDLSKESADMSGDWGEVDKTKLRNSILKAKNYKECINACYLVTEDGWEDTPSSNLKFPVCKISNGKLILSAKGCESALSFLEKNTSESYYQSAKAKLKKYYKKLDLSTENFSEVIDINKTVIKEEKNKMTKKEIAEKFSLTYEQLEDELRSELCECQFECEDWYGDKCLTQRFYLMDYDDSFVYCYDCQNTIYVKVPYVKNNDDVEINFEQCSRIKFSPVDWQSSSVPDEDDDVEEDFVKKFTTDLKDKYVGKVGELNTEIENLKVENKKVTDKFASLEATIEEKNKFITEKETELFSKDEIISEKETEIANKESEIANFNTELEGLKAFKLEKTKQEIQLKADNLYSEYAEFVSEEEKTELNKILFDFENFEDFEAKVAKTIAPKMKAQLFALKQNNSIPDTNKIDISLMGLPVDDIKAKKTSKSSIEQLEEYIQN